MTTILRIPRFRRYFTDIVIPFSKVSSDIFKSYERGADIVNSRKDEFREACFLGQVEGMDIRRVEERGSTIGGELIFTIHHGDWNISDITLTTPFQSLLNLQEIM